MSKLESILERTKEHDAAKTVFDNIKDIEAVKELNWRRDPSIDYVVSDKEEVLEKIIGDRQVVVVTGGFFGDEAKGKTVAGINANIMARFNSGENAGHTVYFNGKKYVFHLMPSGIGNVDAIKIIGPNCVMDPVSFYNKEVKPLIENTKTKHLLDKLYIGNTFVVTPYHKIIDALGKNNSSTLKGMSPVHADKALKKAFRLDDLLNLENDEERLRSKIEKGLKIYNSLLKENNINPKVLKTTLSEMNTPEMTRIPNYILNFLDAETVDEQIEYLVNLYRETVFENPFFKEKRKDVNGIINKTLKEGGRVLIEGSQSTNLSNNHPSYYEDSTSADTSPAGLIASSGIDASTYNYRNITVIKFVSSRVGNGSNPTGHVNQEFFSSKGINSFKDLEGVCENFEGIRKQYFSAIQDNGVVKPEIYVDKNGSQYLVEEAMAISEARTHGEEGATTKKPRIVGLVDLVDLANNLDKQGPYLSISAMDRGDEYEKVGLTVAYIYHHLESKTIISDGITYKNGTIIRPGNSLPNREVLKHCHRIVKVLGGWKGTPLAADKNPDGIQTLPEQVKEYIANVENVTGHQVISIGNGPETNNMIYLKRIERTN